MSVLQKYNLVLIPFFYNISKNGQKKSKVVIKNEMIFIRILYIFFHKQPCWKRFLMFLNNIYKTLDTLEYLMMTAWRTRYLESDSETGRIGSSLGMEQVRG